MITSSTVAAGHAQRDGRRYVVETHAHDDGSVERIEYGPITTHRVDLQAIADGRARALNDERATQGVVQQERKAAEEKATAVLAAAVTKGDLTEDEIRKAGLPVPSERAAAVAERAEGLARG